MATALQRIRAIHLYRHGLKNMLSWAVRREVFYVEQEKMRAEFEQHTSLTDPIQIERALERGEARLRENLHPDPYIVPYRPGGSLYARNPPFDPAVSIHMDFGREGGH
ncbi:NADH dehydrogenase [ubiquinone] 1 beta subcomplex subunit 9 [Chlorella vulgaris]